MPLDRLIEQHRKQVRAARSGAVIFETTLDAVRELGFNRAAIVHAQWFVRPGKRLLFLHNFDEWGHIFVARKRSEEHTSELQSLMRISYAVFCLKKKTNIHTKLV